MSWHFFVWHPPRNQVLETRFMSTVIFKCLESSIALPKKVQLIIYICKTFTMIFKCLKSSITLPKKVKLIIFLSISTQKLGRAIGKFSHQWVNTEHKASLTLNSTILADSKATVDREIGRAHV